MHTIKPAYLLVRGPFHEIQYPKYYQKLTFRIRYPPVEQFPGTSTSMCRESQDNGTYNQRTAFSKMPTTHLAEFGTGPEMLAHLEAQTWEGLHSSTTIVTI